MVKIGPLNIGTFELVGLAIAVPVILGFSRAGGIQAATGFGAGLGRAIASPVPSLTDFLVSIGLITRNGQREEQKESQEAQAAQLDALRRKQREDEERLEGIARRTRERIEAEGRTLPAYIPPAKTFRECYQTELTEQEFSGLVGAGAPCIDVGQYEYVLGNNNSPSERDGFRNGSVVSPSFIIPTGGFDVRNIATRLGFRDLSPQQAQRISLGQTGLGALTQAYRSGEISEDVLRSGFRETIR